MCPWLFLLACGVGGCPHPGDIIIAGDNGAVGFCTFQRKIAQFLDFLVTIEHG